MSTRSILYGEVLEIGQTMLAMTEDEVTEMLAGARDEMTSGLLALAGGWPAVIGLASLTTSDSPLPEERLDLPGQLYEFFADEVYRGLEPDVRNGLGLLATAPSLDRELAVELLGAERARARVRGGADARRPGGAGGQARAAPARRGISGGARTEGRDG